MAGGFFPTFVTSDDTIAIQKRLASEIDATERDVGPCLKLSPETKAAWATWRDAARIYTREEASFWRAKSQVDRGQMLEKQLVDWQQRVQAAGCLSGPVLDLSVPGDGTASAITEAVKWGAIGVVGLGVIYGISVVFRR